jgi:hypothetical protein
MSARGFDRFTHGVEHWQTQMSRATFTWRYTTDHFSAVGYRLLGMEGALRAGKTLADHFCVFVYQNTH